MADNTRYKITNAKSVPPDLRAVLIALEKETRNSGYVQNQGLVRASIMRASKDYTRGSADDLARFLRNHQVLVQDWREGFFWFDSDRADLILTACDTGTEPPSPPDSSARLKELKAKFKKPLPSDEQDAKNIPDPEGDMPSVDELRVALKAKQDELDDLLLQVEEIKELEKKATEKDRALTSLLAEKPNLDRELAFLRAIEKNKEFMVSLFNIKGDAIDEMIVEREEKNKQVRALREDSAKLQLDLEEKWKKESEVIAGERQRLEEEIELLKGLIEKAAVFARLFKNK